MDEEAPKKKRQRGPRRNYQSEVAMLQARINAALRLLSRITGADNVGTHDPAVIRELCSIAVETLEGK